MRSVVANGWRRAPKASGWQPASPQRRAVIAHDDQHCPRGDGLPHQTDQYSSGGGRVTEALVEAVDLEADVVLLVRGDPTADPLPAVDFRN